MQLRQNHHPIPQCHDIVAALPNLVNLPVAGLLDGMPSLQGHGVGLENHQDHEADRDARTCHST